MKKTILILLVIISGLMLSCSGEELEEEVIEEGKRSLYVFGDSWADQMDDGQFQQELVDRGYDDSVQLIPFGIGGTTMINWARDSDGMLSELIETIVEDPNPNPIVFFTLGGNDMLGGRPPELVQESMRTVLTELEASRDDLQIVYAQYDVMSPDIEPGECIERFDEIFGATTPETINAIWLEFYAQAEQIAAEFDRTVAVNTYGSLQGNSGNPDFTSWSPVEYFADCIHLNDDGYDIYLDTVFDEALTPMIE